MGLTHCIDYNVDLNQWFWIKISSSAIWAECIAIQMIFVTYGIWEYIKKKLFRHIP